MIRKYETADLDELLDLWYDASQIAHPFLSNEFLEHEREEISQRHLPNAETWVFEEEGEVVGFVALLGDEVGAIFVSPRRQGKGIGRALMDHVRASHSHLELDVFEANQIGRAFYDAYGFKVIEKRSHEKTGQTTLRMRLDC